MLLNCAIVGEGSVISIIIEEWKMVALLKKAIADEQKYDFAASKLQLFLAKATNSGWLQSRSEDAKKLKKGETTELIKAPAHEDEQLQGEIDLAEMLKDMDQPSTSQIHVLVVIPEGAAGSALLQQVNTVARQDVVWYGMQGSVGRGEGIDLKDERTLSRDALTADIISRLEETHVVLVKSPPITGKTSLATLVSRALVNRHREGKEKAAIFNFSALKIFRNQSFEEAFEQQCGVTWLDANSTLPGQGYMVCMVLDEAQVIYKEGTSSPRHESSVFLKQVKYVLNDAAYTVKILMFAAYGSAVEYTRLATPSQFDKRMVFTIEELNFSHDKVQEYASKWFEGFASLEGSSAMEAFCDTLEDLEELTGGHVGLCATAIHTLNEVYFSRRRSGNDLPSADAWIRMLQSGSLYEANDNALFEPLTLTRAVRILKTLDTDELDQLERIGVRSSYKPKLTFRSTSDAGLFVMMLPVKQMNELYQTYWRSYSVNNHNYNWMMQWLSTCMDLSGITRRMLQNRLAYLNDQLIDFSEYLDEHVAACIAMKKDEFVDLRDLEEHKREGLCLETDYNNLQNLVVAVDIVDTIARTLESDQDWSGQVCDCTNCDLYRSPAWLHQQPFGMTADTLPESECLRHYRFY